MTVRYHLRPHCHISSDAYLVTFRNNIKYVGLKISIKKWLTSLEFEQTKYKVENESYYTLYTYIFGIFFCGNHTELTTYVSMRIMEIIRAQWAQIVIRM